jgi:ribosome biogenesis GTPase / thiamine phosphate phosphatase
VWIGPTACKVLEGEAITECLLPADRRLGTIAAGDEVGFTREPPPRVTSVRPRRTVLSRPDPENPRHELVIAANVDIVVIVAAIRSPPLRLGLLDRYLVAIQRGGAAAAICVSKIDLVREGARREALADLAPNAARDVPVFSCSVNTGEGLDAVRALLRGRTSALVGHSGVGKSSLANALHPSLAIITNAVSAYHGRGKHTTTASALHVLPDGSRVVDTPGVRSFGLWAVGPADLAGYFPELAEHGARCRFGDCSHTHEPACGVLAATEAGAIKRARYEAYLRILATIDD